MKTVILTLDKTFYDKDSVINNLHDSLEELTLKHKLTEITSVESSFHHLIFNYSDVDKHINIQAAAKHKDIFCMEVNTLIENGLKVMDVKFDSISNELKLMLE